jgi:NADH-quinone oxidoreductase subunit M
VAAALENWLGGPYLLTLVVFLPLATGLALMAFEGGLRALGSSVRVSDSVWRVVGLVASLVGFALTLEVWRRFDPGVGALQLVEHAPWIPNYGIHYYLGVDGVSLFLVVLTGFLLPVVLLASWTDIVVRVKQYVFFMLALQTGMLGSFLSVNLFLFYVFWEVTLIPMYFIIGIWGGPRRIYATVKFFIYTMLGSLLMLIGILVLVYASFQATGVLSFDYVGFGGAPGIIDAPLAAWPDGEPWWTQRQLWLFLAFAFAFAIKVPMFPFHTWLPDAHVEAPTPGSAVLAGVLLKMGTYGFIRYAMPLFPEAAEACAPLLLTLSVIGIVYGALVAMVQQDVKKLVAYSSVSHLGFVMLGLFAFNLQGIEGALLQMVNHGISTGALFILVGMVYERRHTREIEGFGGIAHVMPLFGAFFVIATASSIGLPLLNGFVGEFLILLGAFGRSPFYAVIGATGVVLGAVYMLWMVRRVFFGPVRHEVNRGLLDLSLREQLVAWSLVVPMVWIGVYPASFLLPMERTTSAWIETMQRRGSRTATLERFALPWERGITAVAGGGTDPVAPEPAAGGPAAVPGSAGVGARPEGADR